MDTTTEHLERLHHRRAFTAIGVLAMGFSSGHIWSRFDGFMPAWAAALVVVMLDVWAWLLLDIDIVQVRANRPVPLLRYAAYAFLGFSIFANATAGDGWLEMAGWAIPPVVFTVTTVARRWVALRNLRADQPRAGVVRRLRLGLGRQAAARTVTKLALPRWRDRRRVRRSLATGRLAPDVAVRESRVLDQLHPLLRASVVADLGAPADGAESTRTALTRGTPRVLTQPSPEGANAGAPKSPRGGTSRVSRGGGLAGVPKVGRGLGAKSTNAALIEDLQRVAEAGFALGVPTIRKRYGIGDERARELRDAVVWPEVGDSGNVRELRAAVD